MPDLSGTCACGRITWRSAVSPFRSVLCHCAACRASAGAGPVGYMGFGKVSVVWTGQRVFRVPITGVTRGACPDCGTALSYMCTRWPGELYVHATTLIDPALFCPEAHIHWAERLRGTRAMDDLPKCDGRGPSALISLRRRQCAAPAPALSARRGVDDGSGFRVQLGMKSGAGRSVRGHGAEVAEIGPWHVRHCAYPSPALSRGLHQICPATGREMSLEIAAIDRHIDLHDGAFGA